MATKSKENQKPIEETSAKSALLFEMDNIALGARRIRYEILSRILKEQRIELTPVLFSRYCLHPAPQVYMPAFLEAMKYTAASPEKVVERLLGESTSRFMQKNSTVSDGLIKWLDAAKARGAAIACASMLPQAAVESVAAHLGCDRWNVKFLSGCTAVDKGFPRADNWLKMAKLVGRNPKRCLAITSSMAVAKTALAAMMNVVVVTDEFTAYQDFCGTNLVCSDLKEVNPNEFFEQISF